MDDEIAGVCIGASLAIGQVLLLIGIFLIY